MKTRTQNGTWLGAAVTLALAAGAAQGQVTSFHMIGSLAGTNNYSSGYGISDDGSVCVGHSGNNFYYGSSSHAFRWTSDSGIVDLDPLAPAAGAYGVSADGQIIVGGETSGSVKAVRWGAGSSSITDQLYHGGEVYGLSHDGSTAVGYDSSSGGGGFRPHRASIYSDHGHQQFVDTPAAGVTAPTTSEALAANSDGSIIVGWGVFGGVQQAFRWTSADGMSPISTLSSVANGVSGDGSIIVGSFNSGTLHHAFRWTAATGLVDLGTLPGMVRSDAFAISTDGSTIVGTTTSATGSRRAFIWRQDLGMQDLNVVLAGAIPAGRVLIEARAVNATGTAFTGGSQIPGQNVEAWVATIGSCVAPQIVQSTGSIVVAAGQSAQLSVAAGGFGPFAYQWRKDAVAIAGATGDTLTLASASPGDAGSYDCVVSGACGTATSSPSALTVHAACAADLDDGTGTGTFDNGVDINDLLYFLAQYEAGLTGADLDDGSMSGTPDGGVDVNDLLFFLGHYEVGC